MVPQPSTLWGVGVCLSYDLPHDLASASLGLNDSAAYRRLFAPLYVSLHMESVEDPLAWKSGFIRTL